MLRTTLAATLLLASAPLVSAQEPAEPKAEPTPPKVEQEPTPEAKPAEDTPTATLPELVVTPTRRAADPFDVPATVNKLTTEEAIERRGARTVPEALAQLPGVNVQKTAQGQGTVFMRGQTGFRTLMLIDGVRFNNSIMRSGPNEYMALVDPYAIEAWEVVDGPGSVLYGSDAIGGSINMLTRRPILRDEPGWTRELGYRYSSADQSHSVRAEAGGWYEDFGVRAGGTWRDFDDLEGGRHTGVQQRTGFDALAGDLAAEWRLGEGTRLRATLMHTDLDDVWRTHKTVFGSNWHGTTVGNELARVLNYERTHGALHLEADNATEWLQDARISISGSRLFEQQDRTRSDGRRDLRFIRVNTGGVAAQASTPLTMLGEGARLLYGIDWYHDDVDSGRQDYAAGTGLLSSTKIQGSVADDARYDLVGAFLQWQQPLAAWMEVHAGVRFTWADVYAGAVQDPATGGEISLDDTFTNLSASGQILLRPAEGWRLYTSLAQSFRAPNLSDLTRLDTARSGEQEIASPGLDPEHYLTAEIGTKWRESGFSIEALYFYTWITDQIVRSPNGQTNTSGDLIVVKSNAGDGYVQGASGQLSYRIPEGMFVGWKLSGGADWSEGSVDVFPTSAPVKESEPISKLPPASGFLRLGYEPEGQEWWVEAEARAARSQERLSTADNRDTQRVPPGGTPGYAVFALRGGFRPMKGLKVSIGLENLGDRDYRYHGSGVNEAGFHAVLSFLWEF